MRSLVVSVVALVVVFAPERAEARDLYRSVVTVIPDPVVQTSNSLVDLEELFDDDSLAELFPGYVPASPQSPLFELAKLGFPVWGALGAAEELCLLRPQED